MRLLPLIACLTAIPILLSAQNKYVYTADIRQIEDDKVKVTLVPPAIKEQEIVFSFPRVIPGSYSEKSFGKYIEDFTATDKKGKKLKAKKLNPNQYLIQNAPELGEIRYLVNDTWDKPDKDFIFQPGGTNIEAGSNVVMNNHAFYGYFEGYKMLPFEIRVDKPDTMYASTHLEVGRNSSTEDVLLAPNYVYLADNPVFYSVPDTSSFTVGETVVNVSVISASGKVNSRQVASYLQPMALGLSNFFNGLPVKSYQFLFYFESIENLDDKKKGGEFGALEHNYSSLYYLPELPFEPRLKSLVLEVASHEFLHILTPLNLHSEEIEDFDFINPKMSEHLWLYEGVTEYFAHLTQVQNGLLSEKGFFKNMREKINEAEKYGNFSMTAMSGHVLENKFKDKYGSVYNKGALTGLMLDILIREKTGGQKDLKTVIMELTKRYGPGKPFKDANLFTELVALSHPDVRPFIEDYIIGDKPLPYEQMFKQAGYEFSDIKKKEQFFCGTMGLRFDPATQGFAFTKVEKSNAMGIEEDDLWIAINGTPVTRENLEALWEKYFSQNTEYPELTITIRRNGMERELDGKLRRGYTEAKNNLEPLPTPNERQAKLLKALIKS